jgi:hypothetical protein
MVHYRASRWQVMMTIVVDLATQNEHMQSTKGPGQVLHRSNHNKRYQNRESHYRGVVAVAQGREHALLHSEARLEVA